MSEIISRSSLITGLVFKCGIKMRTVTLLTLFRIAVAPVILLFAFNDIPVFKWLLLSAFITDSLDGFFARHWDVTSKLGAKLDSLADDILFIVCMVLLVRSHFEVLAENTFILSITLILFFSKMAILYFRHKKIVSSMHTYLTKAAAVMQALFFIECMFFGPGVFLFKLAIGTTMLALVEEIVIISTVKEIKENMKGLLFNIHKPNHTP